jgi:hypothetical protein
MWNPSPKLVCTFQSHSVHTHTHPYTQCSAGMSIINLPQNKCHTSNVVCLAVRLQPTVRVLAGRHARTHKDQQILAQFISQIKLNKPDTSLPEKIGLPTPTYVMSLRH